MTSDQLYVWTWLPGQVAPVVAGRVQQVGSLYTFIYGQSYRARPESISLFAPELPLRAGVQEPPPGLSIAGVLRDGSPDRWGRGVIERRRGAAPNALSEIDYMLASSSDRFGALDFQESPEDYVERDESATLDELHRAAMIIDEGGVLSAGLDAALMHGTSLGGARPKATLTEPDGDGSAWLAKFASSDDRTFSVVNAEGAMLELSRAAGIDVPASKVVSSLGKEVLLVRRFDRDGVGGRRHVVSGLTMSQTDEMYARYVSYPQILDVLRRYAEDASRPGPALFQRIAMNIAVSNNDDHARNHAAFWDGNHLELTPAYDLAPGQRSGDTFEQAMAFGRGDRGAQVSNFAALLRESETYGLSAAAGRDVIDRLVSAIEDNWNDAADLARLSAADKRTLRQRQVLPRAAFFDYQVTPL